MNINNRKEYAEYFGVEVEPYDREAMDRLFRESNPELYTMTRSFNFEAARNKERPPGKTIVVKRKNGVRKSYEKHGSK